MLEARAPACLARIGLVMLLALVKAVNTVTVSLTLRPLKNNGVSESLLMCQNGVSGFIAHSALFGEILAQASHAQSIDKLRFTAEEKSSSFQPASHL